MSGVLTHRLGEGAGSGGSGGTLGSLSWNNIYGAAGSRFGSTNTLTISGITGELTLGASASGPVTGLLAPIKNGVFPSTWTPGGAGTSVTVENGDTLAWGISNVYIGDVAGTVTVTRTDTGAVVDSFTYFVQT